MFDTLTSAASLVLLFAEREATRARYPYLAIESYFLGFISSRAGLAAKVFDEVGVGLKAARVAVAACNPYDDMNKLPWRAKPAVVTRVFDCMQRGYKVGVALGHPFTCTEHLLQGLIDEDVANWIKILDYLEISKRQLSKKMNFIVSRFVVGGLHPEYDQPTTFTPRGVRATAVLRRFGVDLTHEARQKRIDPVIGRDEEVVRVTQILGRRRKNNPVLVGEPGVGKTAVAEGLAVLIVGKDVPPSLRGKMVVSIDLGSLVAGTRYRGEFESRLRRIVEAVRVKKGKVILVIDEIHTLVGSGSAEGSVDGANILKPDLARGTLRCLGATTIGEYRKYIARDAALERRFQPITVEQPTVDDVVEILQGLRERYEFYHQVTFGRDALIAAASLSDRYIADRFLPDKAIDLIDEAGARASLLRQKLPLVAKGVREEIWEVEAAKLRAIRRQRFEEARDMSLIQKQLRECWDRIVQEDKIELADPTCISENDIAEVVSAWTGIPVSNVSQSEAEKLLELEGTLHKSIIGQYQAVSAVSKAIRRARAGLKSQERPIANFIFAGPTGTGKTELAKVLAIYFFGSSESLIRLDMSEYMERHTVSKIIGSPPGYLGHADGGLLTEKVRSRPYSLILLDEIEKAHPDIYNIMLQIFDDGQLTDSKGQKIDFRNVLMILTTNVGAVAVTVLMSRGDDQMEQLEKVKTKNPKMVEGSDRDLDIWSVPVEDPSLYKGIAYDPNWPEEDKFRALLDTVKLALRKVFRPEFLNRLDEIIVFRLLSKSEIWDIGCVMLKNLSKDMFSRKGFYLEFTRSLVLKLVEVSYEKEYGARPLRRAITDYIEDLIADKVLNGMLVQGDYFLLDGTFVMTDKAKEEAKEEKGKLKLRLNKIDSEKVSIYNPEIHKPEINFFSSWTSVAEVGLFEARGQALLDLNALLTALDLPEVPGDSECVILEDEDIKPNKDEDEDENNPNGNKN
jgi:ATP-dependent Clp protease ATP-binding subunit ClpC